MVLLDQDGLSAEGTLEELRDRRLRFDVMKADPGLDVPVYDTDFRKDRLPVATSELLMQSSREEFVPSGSGGRALAGPTDSAQAPEPVVAEGNLREPPLGASEQVPPTAPAEVIESHPPASQPQSRI